MTHLTMGGFLIAELSVQHLSGSSGVGTHFLTAQIDVTPTTYSSVAGAISNFRGVVDVAGGGRLAELRPTGRPCLIIVPAAEGRNREEISFAAELDRAKLDALEEIRKAGHITLNFHLLADVKTAEKIDVGEATVSSRVVSAAWTEILEQMGYQETLVIEVPLPTSVREGPIREACQHLRSAQRAFQDGKYREAIGQCRDVLDSLDRARGDATPEGDDSAKARAGPAPTNQKQMSKDERFDGIGRALKTVSNLARHADDIASRTVWTRTDAHCHLAAVAAILRRAVPQP